MPRIVLETQIGAPPEICFDFMRDIRVHTESMVATGERAVAGVTDGLISLGQTVTFEGTHFGMRQRMTVKVVEFERPRLFVDEMIDGRFKAFKHIHEFSPLGEATRMVDTLIWISPLGLIGRLVDKLVIKRHLTQLVTKRNARLKRLAEEAYNGQ